MNDLKRGRPRTIQVLEYLSDGLPRGTKGLEVNEPALLADPLLLQQTRYSWFRHAMKNGFIRRYGKAPSSKYADQVLWVITPLGDDLLRRYEDAKG